MCLRQRTLRRICKTPFFLELEFVKSQIFWNDLSIALVILKLVFKQRLGRAQSILSRKMRVFGKSQKDEAKLFRICY